MSDLPVQDHVSAAAAPDPPARLGTLPAVVVGQAYSVRDQAPACLAQRKANAAGAVRDVAEAFRVAGANLGGFPLASAVCNRAVISAGLACVYLARRPDLRRPLLSIAAAKPSPGPGAEMAAW